MIVKNSHLFYIATHPRVRALLGRRVARHRLLRGPWPPRSCGGQGFPRVLLRGALAGAGDVHGRSWLILWFAYFLIYRFRDHVWRRLMPESEIGRIQFYKHKYCNSCATIAE